ncbi:chaperone modulator CbpM [Marinobacter sp. F4216]|uniref:chaperone modulator CbpM n=1 Tax=Marinobacter sp. F4216 TaxID=2874281 RepID=UPI001CBBF6C5|nr:chaperone modulator CbpM [Marinobacter sp. F4216]MBZ2168819.1 chaperone modulator CbpM [Marinobacter sp. F4216]
MSRDDDVLVVEITDPQIRFTFREICEQGECHGELVLKMVSYGIIEPVNLADDAGRARWLFDQAALMRLRKAIRLQRDLKMNLPGLAMSLDLLDEVDEMRREITALRRQLRHFSGAPEKD